jgi:hypothetical protein
MQSLHSRYFRGKVLIRDTLWAKVESPCVCRDFFFASVLIVWDGGG